LEGNPANIQDFYTFSAKKESNAHKSCIIAGILKNGNKIEKIMYFRIIFGLSEEEVEAV